MTVPRPEHLLTVGHVRRGHGLQGEVVVRLSTNRTERLDPGSVLYTAEGSLEVVRARPKDKDHLVLFVGIHDRDQADALGGTELLAEALDDPDELWVHDLIGSRVVDQSGVERGLVREVEANPASDLLVLEGGALVPVRFITSTACGRIEVDVPSGLFEL